MDKLNESISEIINRPNYLICTPPSEDIYDFVGSFSNEEAQESIGLDNTMWANTLLTNGKILGIVVFVGKETRSEMNSRVPRTKFGIFDEEVNYYAVFLCFFMVLDSFLLIACKGFGKNWYMQFFRFILLLSSIVPISVKVNLDLSKLIFTYKINSDKNIKGTQARNSDIPEELGRVQYILTDKTGTLTQNDMNFKRLSVNEVIQFSEENFNELKRLLQINCKKFTRKDLDTQNLHEVSEKKKIQREKSQLLRELLTGLVICHNVTPAMENGKKIYQASSPDEIALIKFAEEIEMILIERNEFLIKIENSNKNVEEYEILAILPFASDIKRMGILVRTRNSDCVIFFLKGADNVMIEKVKQVYKSFVMDECENLSREGLRTLVLAQKYMSFSDYLGWKKKLDQAALSLVDRNNQIKKAWEFIENNMELLGVTGVEDKLQDDVCETIESLRHAGIKVWMLTGDKSETAKCIATAAGIKNIHEDVYEIKECLEPIELHNKIIEYSNKLQMVLLIDGSSLCKILEEHEKLFFEIVYQAASVIFCRCLPTQKAMITEKLKKMSNKRVLCIGDGGNDVGMIQQADVGIGIIGKEGLQAALASDYSIPEFKYLKVLILWHGRLAYKISAALTNFVVHRGLIISMIQLGFSFVFYYVTIPLFNGMLNLGYSTVFTTFPVVSIGAAITFFTLILFPTSFLDFVTITFSALIISEYLNLLTLIHTVKMIMIVSVLSSFCVYIATIYFLNEYIHTSIINIKFLEKIGFISLFSWLPIKIIAFIISKIDPSEEQKLMMRV